MDHISKFSNVNSALLTPWRLKWYPLFILFGLTIAFLIVIFTGEGGATLTGRIGGDFPAFYGIGRIIASGDLDQLYDAGRQKEEQIDILADEGGFLPFAYPPFAALFYYPFAFFPYRVSYVLHTIISLAALFFTLRLTYNINKKNDDHFLLILTLAITFFPIFQSVFLGQNTTHTLILITLIWWAYLNKYEYIAGVFLGLLLYKPQFALPLAGLFLLSKRWRVLITFSLLAVVFYLICVAMMGHNWLIEWYNFAHWFSETDAFVNKRNAISWLGFFRALMGANVKVANFLGYILSFMTILFISGVWLRNNKHVDFSAQFALAVACLTLIPPHANYYDLGLLVFTYAMIFRSSVKYKTEIICITWIFAFCQNFSHYLNFSPLFFLNVFVLYLSIITQMRLAVGKR